MKKLIHQQSVDTPHWVGDAFPVRSAFTYRDLARAISPFLLLDYAGPTEFAPTSSHVRGVGEHPHRGFETVTIIYHGEVEHRDSSGGGGVIRPGDVQWMTAAAGVVHEEKHSKEYAQKGGPFELIQLWVNLPAKHKMDPPRYQSLLKEQIPAVDFDGGQLRVIAGEYQGHKGPAKTHTPINLWDMKLEPGREFKFKVPTGQTAAIFLMEGWSV
jgi:redox-sensitive bicupin YhaK (pirin superfamily)